MSTRVSPLTNAARISARWNPKLLRGVEGLEASVRATSARPIANVSENMCPASARSARLSVRNPPTISTTVKPTVRASTTASARRDAARWSCACPWPSVRPPVWSIELTDAG
jgi:hypothetical protein